MSRAFPLQSLLDLSQLRLDDATRKLGELLAGEQEASQRHALLVQYRDEYQSRFVDAAKNGIGPREWQNYASFLARLDDAVKQAEAAMQSTRQRTAAGQREWLQKQGKVKAFDTLSDRHQTRLAHQDQRRDQKASDEHSALKKRMHADE